MSILEASLARKHELPCLIVRIDTGASGGFERNELFSSGEDRERHYLEEHASEMFAYANSNPALQLREKYEKYECCELLILNATMAAAHQQYRHHEHMQCQFDQLGCWSTFPNIQYYKHHAIPQHASELWELANGDEFRGVKIFRCNDCRIALHTRENLNSHRSYDGHADRRNNFLDCRACGVALRPAHLARHYLSYHEIFLPADQKILEYVTAFRFAGTTLPIQLTAPGVVKKEPTSIIVLWRTSGEGAHGMQNYSWMATGCSSSLSGRVTDSRAPWAAAMRRMS